MKKAQAGLDFLMTYSWALLLIVLVVAALFALGIFDAGAFVGSRSAGFAQVRPVAWRLDTDGNLTLKLADDAGTNVNITSINATFGVANISYSDSLNISNGKQSDAILVGSFPNSTAPGASYSIALQIQYIDMNTNFTYTDGGTVTGKVG